MHANCEGPCYNWPLAGSRRRPRQQLVNRPAVDNPIGRHAGIQRALSAVAEEVELARRMRVGVDAEITPDLQREVEQPGWRVTTFGSRVDLDGCAVIAAGGEHRFGVELRLRSDAAVAGDQPTRAVPENVGVVSLDRDAGAFNVTAGDCVSTPKASG